MSDERRWLSNRVSADMHIGQQVTDIDQHIGRVSVDIRRSVDRYIGRVSIDISVEWRPTCRPIYRPTDAFSTQDP